MSRGNLIIIGASARAAAQSAIRAGYEPWCIDLFADRDLQAIAPVKRCPREWWPQGILELIKDAPPGPVLFTGAMENHIEVVAAIVQHRPTLGTSPHGMAYVRSPLCLRSIISSGMGKLSEPVSGRSLGWFWIPQNCSTHERPPWHAPLTWGLGMLFGVRFLIKPRRGAGGLGIRTWTPFRQVGHGEYVQRYRPGTSVSAVFRARNGMAMMLGSSMQLIGDGAFGASPFGYVGNIGPVDLGCEASSKMQFIGMAIAEHVEGIFGVDAVLTHPVEGQAGIDRIYPVEINPRYVASVEVYERCNGFPLLVPVDPSSTSTMNQLHPPAMLQGKAVVYAKRRSKVPDLMASDDQGQLADIPHIGEVIERGQPICTVFAEGATGDVCYARLRDMAKKVYTQLQPA